MRNAGLEEAQAGIKIAGRNINNLKYADNTTFFFFKFYFYFILLCNTVLVLPYIDMNPPQVYMSSQT